MSNIPTFVRGNVVVVALPLESVTLVEGGGATTEGFVPLSTDEVTVWLRGCRRYRYTPLIDGNVLRFTVGADTMRGVYAVEVTVVRADGTRLRSMKRGQLRIVETNEEAGVVPSDAEFGVTNVTLDADCFLFAKGDKGDDGADGVGIASLAQTAESLESGGVNTWTATLTDGTTYTFDVRNGLQGERGAQGEKGDKGDKGEKGDDGVTPDMSGYYTATATDALLADKAYRLGSFDYPFNAMQFNVGSSAIRWTISKGSPNNLAFQNSLNGKSYTMPLNKSGEVAVLDDIPDISGKADVMPLVAVSGSGDVAQTVEANKFYKFGEIDSLDLTLTAPASGVLAQYFGKFTASADWTALTLPASVTTSSKSDTIAAGKTYEFSIVDNVINISEL